MIRLAVEVHADGDVTVSDYFGGSGLYYSSGYGITLYDEERKVGVWNACDELADAAKEIDALLKGGEL